MDSDNVVIIVQARLGSTRLPGKILRDLNGYPVLQHVLERCGTILGRDKVVCVGINSPSEQPVREFVENLGFEFYAGSEHDVLSRYYHAARLHSADWVVRVTADCPLLDPDICRGLIDQTIAGGFDFGITVGWPHGLDCEVMRFSLLEQSFHLATSSDDREHVTLWAKRAEGLKRLQFRPEHKIANLERYRWVLDYPEDYELLAKVADYMDLKPESALNYRQVIACLTEHSDWLKINGIRIKEWAEAQQKLMSGEKPE